MKRSRPDASRPRRIRVSIRFTLEGSEAIPESLDIYALFQRLRPSFCELAESNGLRYGHGYARIESVPIPLKELRQRVALESRAAQEAADCIEGGS